MTAVSSPVLVESIPDDVAMSFPSVWREILGDRPLRRVARLCLILGFIYQAITAQDLTSTTTYAALVVAFVGIEIAFVWLHYVAKSSFSCESLLKRMISVENGQILIRQRRMSAAIRIQGALWREIQSVSDELNSQGFPDVACIVITDPSKSLWSQGAIILCGFDDLNRTTWRQLLTDGGATQIAESVAQVRAADAIQ